MTPTPVEWALVVGIVVALVNVMWLDLDYLTHRKTLQRDMASMLAHQNLLQQATPTSASLDEPLPQVVVAVPPPVVEPELAPSHSEHVPYVYRVDTDGTAHHACRLGSEVLD